MSRLPRHLAALLAVAALLIACGSEDEADLDTTDAASDTSSSPDLSTPDSTEPSDATDLLDETDAAVETEIEIAGEWRTQFDTTEVISSASWAWMDLIEFDNAENLAITQNPSDDMFNPEAFNRIVWTEPEGGAFAYCMVAFGLATLDEARASSASADASDLEQGCGGFAWTLMTAVAP